MTDSAAKAPESAPKAPLTMETIVSFCHRKGYIFQASEIYGGLNGFFDYGPLGVELKNNIKASWWRNFVYNRDDMVGLDSAIIQNPALWVASGHVGGFNDPMVDCKESKERYRADHLLWGPVVVAGETIGYVSLITDERDQERADEMAEKMKRRLAKQGELAPVALKPFTAATEAEIPLIPSPATGKPGSLTEARKFNMMFKTYVGALEGNSSVAYLRPETCGGIFTNFKNVLDTGRVKLPFGIAQIGKAFRNEITPRNFIYRSREFEQMEIEYFISDDADAWKDIHAAWVKAALAWYISIGVDPKRLSTHEYPKEELAFYSKATTDLFFEYPFGKQELMGVAARGSYDLDSHSKAIGKQLDYFDEVQKRRFVPHVVEPSFGLDRAVLVTLLSAYDEDIIEGEKRIVLRLKPSVAPFKAAILPLLKNKPELVAKAEEIYNDLRKSFRIDYDESGAIGRRYRRQDEIGTPFDITVDFETLEKGTVTVRDRDTTQQIRLPVGELRNFLEEKVNA
jgi:glycyl-tRNA synthetase